MKIIIHYISRQYRLIIILPNMLRNAEQAQLAELAGHSKLIT